MLKLHGWFWIHSFEIVMWVVHSDINCNLFFSQLDFFVSVFIFDLLDVKVENSHSPHVKDDRKVKIFIGPPPFEGRLRMAFVWAQQVPRSCSISNVQILNFTGCHSLVALTNLDTEKCSSSCRFSKTWYLFVCVHTSLFIMKEFASCICKPRSNLYFNISGTTSVSASLLGKRNIRSHTPEPVERKNAIPLWANRWRWLIPQP